MIAVRYVTWLKSCPGSVPGRYLHQISIDHSRFCPVLRLPQGSIIYPISALPEYWQKLYVYWTLMVRSDSVDAQTVKVVWQSSHELSCRLSVYMYPCSTQTKPRWLSATNRLKPPKIAFAVDICTILKLFSAPNEHIWWLASYNSLQAGRMIKTQKQINIAIIAVAPHKQMIKRCISMINILKVYLHHVLTI